MTTQTLPYEFLARWDDKTGAFRGAHIQFIENVLDDGGNIVSQHLGQARSVGDAKDFPLADILSQVQVDALAAFDMKAAELTDKDAELAAKAAELLKHKEASDSLAAVLGKADATEEEKLAALQKREDANLDERAAKRAELEKQKVAIQKEIDALAAEASAQAVSAELAK
jgi:hypothetical protein